MVLGGLVGPRGGLKLQNTHICGSNEGSGGRLGGVRVGRGEHWVGFGGSPGCLGTLRESPGEHLEEPWRLYGMSWEALGGLRGAFFLSHWLKCLGFIVFYKKCTPPKREA